MPSRYGWSGSSRSHSGSTGATRWRSCARRRGRSRTGAPTAGRRGRAGARSRMPSHVAHAPCQSPRRTRVGARRGGRVRVRGAPSRAGRPARARRARRAAARVRSASAGNTARITCGSSQCGSSASAASRSAIGASKNEHMRQSACSRVVERGRDAVPTGLPRASSMASGYAAAPATAAAPAASAPRRARPAARRGRRSAADDLQADRQARGGVAAVDARGGLLAHVVRRA